MSQQIVRLNVGGQRFETTVSTLTRESDSMLGRLFDKDSKWSERSKRLNEEIFLDADGDIFAYILDYLRYGLKFAYPNGKVERQRLRNAAEYYQLRGLMTFLDEKMATAAISASRKEYDDKMQMRQKEVENERKRSNEMKVKFKRELFITCLKDKSANEELENRLKFCFGKKRTVFGMLDEEVLKGVFR